VKACCGPVHGSIATKCFKVGSKMAIAASAPLLLNHKKVLLNCPIHLRTLYKQPTLQYPTGYIDNAPGYQTSLGNYKANNQVVYLPSNITPVMQITDEV
jgi:hypothetical protein